MTTITSLKDLIQKISNDGDRTSRMFPFLKIDFEIFLTGINEASSIDILYYQYGNINGILQTLYYTEFISEDEKNLLISELDDLRNNRIEYIVSHMRFKTEEGD